MKRVLVLVAVIIASLFVVSCGKKEVKKVSEDSRVATEAFALIETVRKAYTGRDMTTLERSFTKDGYRAVSSGMKYFDSVSLTFAPALMEIEADKVQVNVSWKGTWRKLGKTTEQRGMAVFVLKEKPLKVDAVLNANPFVLPE